MQQYTHTRAWRLPGCSHTSPHAPCADHEHKSVRFFFLFFFVTSIYMGTRMATCEAMQRHTRRRDVRAGVGQSTYACTTWTHMLAVFAADRLSAAALSHRLVMTCYHARAHVRQSTPYLTGKGPCSRHVSPARGAFPRSTLEYERREHTRNGTDPISRGAAEQAARLDQHIRHADLAQSRPTSGTSLRTPNIGRTTSAS